MQAIKKDILLVFLILSLSFILFLPSFSLSLFGDDWLTFWRYFKYLGPDSQGEWNHISYFLTSYGPQDILMGLLQKVFRYESTYYYLISYLLRILAAFSLFPLVAYLTGKKSAAYFSVAFFLITTTGIETTNWVFNMPSYISIIFLNLFFYYLIVSRTDPKKLIQASLLFLLALVTQPIRMHGLLPAAFLLELFWMIQKRDVVVIKKSSLRLVLFTAITLALVPLGLGKSPVATPASLLTQNINQFNSHFIKGEFGFLFNPLITLGSTIIPSDILSLFFGSNNTLIILASTGSLFAIVIIILLINHAKDTHLSNALFLSLVWSVSSFILAWWREPDSIFLTTHRYLIVSAVGISIFIGTLISLKKPRGLKTVIAIITMFLFMFHFFATRNYLNTAYLAHNQKIDTRIWSAIPYMPGTGKSNEQLLFYFIGDGTNDAIVHDVITFGFPPHMALIYNIMSEDKIPVSLSNITELKAAVTDVSSINKVYAFQLQNHDTLVNITSTIRNILIESKQ